MAGQAKYTNYAPVQDDLSSGGKSDPKLGKADHTLLRSLFKTPVDVAPLSNDPTGIKPILDRANELLNPAQQKADPLLFPKGVWLNFQNPDPSLRAPDVPNIDVSKLGLGGPSTPYTPNLASPDPSGGGSVEPVDATLMSVADIKPNLALESDNGTAVPSTTSLNMFSGNQLPASLLPGFRPSRTLPES